MYKKRKITLVIVLIIITITLTITAVSKKILTTNINESIKKIVRSRNDNGKISLQLFTYDQRSSSFPLTENDELFFKGKIRSMIITTKSLDGTGQGFVDIYDHNESNNIISSKSYNDGTEYGRFYEYDDKQRIISSKLIEKDELITSKSYIYNYDQIGERDIYIESRNQDNNKFNYTEMIRYDDENFVIRSDITESGRKKTIKYYIDKDNISKITSESELYNMKETFHYDNNGLLKQIKHFRNADELYLIEEFFYNENISLYKVTTTFVDTNESRDSIYSEFDNYGNWKKVVHKDIDGTPTTRVTRELIYSNS